MKEMRKKTSSRIGLIRYLARNIDGDARGTLNMLHKSLVRSVTTYASPIFLNCSNYWNKAQSIQNQALRAVLRVPQYTSSKYLHEQLHEPKLVDYCSQTTLRYLNDAIRNDNTHILRIIQKTVKLKNSVDLPLSSLTTSLTANWKNIDNTRSYAALNLSISYSIWSYFSVYMTYCERA